MKCTACGLPLSPSRHTVNCPRCGTPVASGPKSHAGTGHYDYEPASLGGSPAAPISVGSTPQNWQSGQAAPPLAFQPPIAQTPMPQPGQMWLPGQNARPTFTPNAPFRPGQPPRHPSSNARIGFIIAGICVCAGGILLVLVYVLAVGQTGNNTTGSANTPVSTHTSTASTTTPTTASTPSPTTTTLPGQQYITNAQMSSVLPSASQPAQPTTTFKVNQQVYVTFNINTGGQSGAICLIWYLNGKSIFNFAFAVGAHNTSSYGQAIYGTPGPAYVELYWASDKTCANQVLAQHVDFTVTT
ncbi:MAG TPA: hypothetical protein VNE38_02545 [Ktedonobacteraceae bacterium]|nr:hypothetical protein [Ktedonobacteraceae bacterium]